MAKRHLDNVKELERSCESEKTALWAEAKKQINQAMAEGFRRGIAQAQERFYMNYMPVQFESIADMQ